MDAPKKEISMRKNIILVFLLLLILQITQILVVNHFIQKLQSAVKRVTLTIEGREISRSTRNFLDQIQDNVIIVAGMNYPVDGLEKLNVYWERFHQKLITMNSLAEILISDPKLLSTLKEAATNADREKGIFEKVILKNTSASQYKPLVHDRAFNFDESMENLKEQLDIAVIKFVEQEKLAVIQEEKVHNLPIQAAAVIGSIIGAILIFVGMLSVTRIVNPLINLTIQYKITATRLKKEREISLVLEKAQAAAQAKSDFLANMSHELRTPMNTILGFSDLLHQSNLNKQQKNYLSIILSSGQHLVELINDLLDFSKIEVGKITFETIDFNLRTIFDDVMNMMKIKIRGKVLDVYIDYPADIITDIKGDPTRLKQVLVNLSNNAVKFTQEGEIGFIVRLENQINCSKDEIPLRISVKDTGIGIAKNKINKVFDEFTQADESTTRKYGGTGLGLSISKSIVEAMGGRLWAQSVVGKGSEFIFTLKVKKGKPLQKPKIDPQIEKLLQGKKIIIVDDNETSQKINKVISESIGCKVLFMAESGSAALAKLNQLAKKDSLPDIILCDIMMADMDGYEMAKKIRSNKKFNDLKIIAVTVKEEEGMSHYIQDHCFDAYLSKPLSKTEMIHCLADCLGFQTQKEKKEELADDNNKIEGLKLLVVEDTLFNRKLMQAILEKLKCHVDFANDGKEAIQKIEAREYDLCLMDLQMPVMGGIEATQIIRKDLTKDLPIIALTAAVTEADHNAAHKAGMNDFIEKPINTKELKEKIYKYTRGQK